MTLVHRRKCPTRFSRNRSSRPTLTPRLQDWLKAREAADIDHAPDTDSPSAQSTSKASQPPPYIPVPDGSAGINTVCPICQEEFPNKYLDSAQEWVWLDTIMVGKRAYHASCYEETMRARAVSPGGGGAARGTPEPVLGKRKAEVS